MLHAGNLRRQGRSSGPDYAWEVARVMRRAQPREGRLITRSENSDGRGKHHCVVNHGLP